MSLRTSAPSSFRMLQFSIPMRGNEFQQAIEKRGAVQAVFDPHEG